MKAFFIILFTLFTSVNTFSQKKTDAISIFKMHLFLNNENADFKGMDSTIIKNESLYNEFSKVHFLKLDTLLVSNNIYIPPKFQFYKLDLAFKSQSISYTRKLVGSEGQFLGLSSGPFDIYVLAIHQETGKSYRLMGFDTNDFLFFLADFKEEYYKKWRKDLSTSYFLKNYKVAGLDFNCLYKGLTKKEFDREKYPCLKRVSDPLVVH